MQYYGICFAQVKIISIVKLQSNAFIRDKQRTICIYSVDPSINSQNILHLVKKQRLNLNLQIDYI